MAQKQGRLPSLSLISAVIVTYRRLMVVWAIPPILVVVAPFVVGMLLTALNFVANEFGALLFGLSVIMVACIRRLIFLYAPSPKARDDALAQSHLLLPLLSAGFNMVVIRYVVSPIWSSLELGSILPGAHIPYMAAFRLAAGMAVLGLVVVARFVGPVSVGAFWQGFRIIVLFFYKSCLTFFLVSSSRPTVRCSSVPLVSNPVTSTIRLAYARCTSLDAVLDFLAGPSDTPGVLMKSSLSTSHSRGRRYQKPTSRAAAAQILLVVFGFTTVAYLTVLGWYQAPHVKGEHTDPFVKTVLVVTCVLTSVVNLLLSTLDGKSHELDPKRFHFKTGHLLTSNLQSNLQNIVISIIIVPLLSIGVMFLATDESIGDTRTGDLMSLGSVCVLATSTLSFYLTAFDEAVRMVLSVPGLKLTRLVGEICQDTSSYLCLDVLLHTVLQGDDAFVRDVWIPSQQKSEMEDEEVRRNDASIEQMANILLYNGRNAVENDACLERDILRVLLLESIGGDRDTRSVLPGAMASPRHMENVRYWVEIGNTVEARREPVAVPLVRGLCAYVGGLGEALLSCTQSMPFSNNPRTNLGQMRSPHFPPSNIRSPFVTWCLPPGAVACAEYAVTAAARCVVWDMKVSSKALAHWRSTHLSMLIPAVLHSAFRLRCGIYSYAKYRRTHPDNGEHFHLMLVSSPELRPLLAACDEAAMLILGTLKSFNGVKDVEFRVQSGCRDWLRQLQACPA